MTSQAEKAGAFRALHTGEPFLLPNPWDVGSARVLQALGFKALATTSSGFAFTLGRSDGRATLHEVLLLVRLRLGGLELSAGLRGYAP
jgi:2-methylisocitrate lyase-like PEP mutase family enzyme